MPWRRDRPAARSRTGPVGPTPSNVQGPTSLVAAAGKIFGGRWTQNLNGGIPPAAVNLER
jgi:hypothetical protein